MSWRYDVVGFLGGDFGLAVAARNSLRALRATGRLGESVEVEVRPPAKVIDRLRALARASVKPPVSTRRLSGSNDTERATLFQMNPLEIAWYTAQWRGGVDSNARNVCVPFWELPLVPRNWRPMLCAMDAILAPTRFVQAACATAVPAERVLHYPQAVFLPDDVRAVREAWGVGGRRTVFIVSFDAGSDIDRKNPWGAIDAFQRAFPSQEDVALLIKTKPWASVPQYVAQANELRAKVGSDRRVQIVDRTLGYAEVLSLYASCDVMISLHRSEGLGLHLMEAMSLGKVVVATGWSGNTDFMSQANSVPVGYRLVPVRTRHSHYLPEVGRKGQEWAEPDVGEAVEALRALHADPARRIRLGETARADMEVRRASLLSGDPFAELEARLEQAQGRAGALTRAVVRTRIHALTRGIRAKGSELLAKTPFGR
jgi:glycosyltransferase involved in cell wall biosynthesis